MAIVYVRCVDELTDNDVIRRARQTNYQHLIAFCIIVSAHTKCMFIGFVVYLTVTVALILVMNGLLSISQHLW